MKSVSGLLMLLLAGFALAEPSANNAQPPSRAAAAKSAISGAQAWRDSDSSQSLDQNALRDSGGEIDKTLEKAATDKMKGGGSAEGIMNELEKELKKQMPDLR